MAILFNAMIAMQLFKRSHVCLGQIFRCYMGPDM